MSKFSIVFFLLLSFTQVWSQDIAVIPQPVSLQPQNGNFVLKDGFSVGISASNAEAKRAADYLINKISQASGLKGSVSSKINGSVFRFRLVSTKNKEIGSEGYLLNVYPDSVSLVANEASGLFYGVQTLLQLLPKEIESKKIVSGVSWTIPCVSIKDYPRFAWRGMMLDVARHFFTKEQVKQFIDEMVRYKYNRLHWHLTDDEGWRIEIKSLPKLTQVGAWRAERVGLWAEMSPPTPDEPRNYGGYYTQEDIREVVKYAKDNFVEVIPEIDMPGHSLAFVASYPEISGTPGNYSVNSGEKLIDWSLPGHPALIDNTISPANESAYEYIDKVMTEVAQLFPYNYIHLPLRSVSKSEKNVGSFDGFQVPSEFPCGAT
ncbi:MAG TPA: hypothetical protein DGG95_17170 [Cytophagales bacterium]|nr:hypothetical protein [Cytophagales bacterium]